MKFQYVTFMMNQLIKYLPEIIYNDDQFSICNSLHRMGKDREPTIESILIQLTHSVVREKKTYRV